jgi:TPR repeat protein
VQQNYAEAARWYRKAAEQGVARSQFNLGLIYDNGRGVPQDYAEAARWYLKAAKQGEAGAQFNLGLMYEYGHGVARNHVQAYRWVSLAASRAVGNDRKDFADAVVSIAKGMTSAQLAEARRLSAESNPK